MNFTQTFFRLFILPLALLLLVSCATQVLNVEKQPDGSYWIATSSDSAKAAFEAGEKQAQEAAEKYKTSYKIIKKKPSSKVTVTPAHNETRWVDQITTATDWDGKVRTIRTSIPVTEWVPERKFTTFFSEIWVKFDRPVTFEKP
jgi:hypothetical protein